MKTPARPHSLRARLVATVLVLLAVTLSVIGVATTLALRQFLYGRLDREVVEANSRFVAVQTGQFVPPGGFRYGRRPGLPRPRPGPAHARRDDPRRRRAARRGEQPGRRVVGGARGGRRRLLVAVPVDGGPTTVDLSIGDYRMVATETGGTVYVIGQPAGGAQDVLARLVVVEVIAIGIALLGGGFAGAVLVRRELRPLERVADTAAKVSALPLDRGEVELAERVRDVDPRTEVGQVASALNQMLDNVGGALEARQDSEMRLRQFIADASHELRTPLAAIRGYAELTRRAALAAGDRVLDRPDLVADRADDHARRRPAAARPPRRGTAAGTRRRRPDAAGARRGQRRPRRRAWTTAGSSTCPTSRSSCPATRPRLTQVLTNLLANARTHTPAGTTVTVGLARGDGGVRGSPSPTTAPASPPDLLPHVFERFARGSASRSRADRQHRAGPRDRRRRGGRARRHVRGAEPAAGAPSSRCGCRRRVRAAASERSPPVQTRRRGKL